MSSLVNGAAESPLLLHGFSLEVALLVSYWVSLARSGGVVSLLKAWEPRVLLLCTSTSRGIILAIVLRGIL